jgi:hypothetical protein
VEEKQIIAAFGDAGAVAMPVLPASTPLPPGPATRAVSPDLAAGSIDIGDPRLTVLIDRCANRYVAEATLPLVAQRGVRIVGAGIAAIGSRLAVATALEQAGIPRPSTLLAFTEDSANLATRQIGVPASLMSLNTGKGWTPMVDLDTADAVIEHRMVLGGDAHATVLVQAGAPALGELTTIHVIGGIAFGYEGPQPDQAGIHLAQEAAKVLQAEIAGVQIAQVSGEQVVWDILPAPDFRAATPIGEESVAQGIARLVTGIGGRTPGNAEVIHGGTTHISA